MNCISHLAHYTTAAAYTQSIVLLATKRALYGSSTIVALPLLALSASYLLIAVR